jgi:hypothetical protein
MNGMMVNQHMRWELNDVARRLDEQPSAAKYQPVGTP